MNNDGMQGMRDLTYDEAFHLDLARASRNWEWSMSEADRTAQRLLATLDETPVAQVGEPE